MHLFTKKAMSSCSCTISTHTVYITHYIQLRSACGILDIHKVHSRLKTAFLYHCYSLFSYFKFFLLISFHNSSIALQYYLHQGLKGIASLQVDNVMLENRSFHQSDKARTATAMQNSSCLYRPETSKTGRDVCQRMQPLRT